MKIRLTRDIPIDPDIEAHKGNEYEVLRVTKDGELAHVESKTGVEFGVWIKGDTIEAYIVEE